MRGGISRRGDELATTAPHEAAHSLLTRSRKWSTSRARGLRVAKRRGMPRSRVAVARKLAVACWATWQTAERLSGARRAGLDAEHHPHRVVADLDALDQGADDVAPGGPVRAIQPVADHVREQAQLADDEPGASAPAPRPPSACGSAASRGATRSGPGSGRV